MPTRIETRWWIDRLGGGGTQFSWAVPEAEQRRQRIKDTQRATPRRGRRKPRHKRTHK